jgi:hypothetical protein
MTGFFQAFELEELEKKQADENRPYMEFLRRRGMSVGLYTLPTGAEDHQHPHAADEMYVVLRGAGSCGWATRNIPSVKEAWSPSTTARSTGSSTSPTTCTCWWCSRRRRTTRTSSRHAVSCPLEGGPQVLSGRGRHPGAQRTVGFRLEDSEENS